MRTLLFTLLLVPMIGFGQNVYIPDANFKAYLVGEPLINTNGDSEIQVSEASAFTGTINVYNTSISDLTGIESFTALTQLYCVLNNLTSLDVSNNTALTNLYCSDNQLTSLDVSNNTALTSFGCYANQLTSLNVSGCTALEELECAYNQLTSLDVSSNTALEFLICYDNQLTSLDVSNNTALTFLACYINSLECLNVKNGNNSVLTSFYAYNNPNLNCIEVDDINYSAANWIDIDSQTFFSTDCNNACSACTPTSSTDIISACNSYTWIDGNTYNTSNNTATYITTNAAGCDSIITLDLTITPNPDVSVTQNGATLTSNQSGATYQWVDCNQDFAIVTGETNQSFTPISTGNYAVIVTVNGCSDTSDCRLVDYTGIGELNTTPKQLVKIVDVLGRKTPFKPNTPLLYIYNDGTVKRKMIIKE